MAAKKKKRKKKGSKKKKVKKAKGHVPLGILVKRYNRLGRIIAQRS